VGMQIYVCVKHVPDSAARITIRDKNQFDESVVFLINPYDENAIEEALRLKERTEDSEMVIVTLGKEKAINTVRSALAMGADRGIFIKTDDYPDSILTARALKTAIAQDGQADIIFMGKESIDSEGMQTMFRLAAEMDIPVATDVVGFSMLDGRVTVERQVEAGATEVIEMSMPCVVGTGKGLNTPRYPKFRDIMKAKKKAVKQVDLTSLHFERPSGSMTILELQPVEEDRHGQILKGQPEEAVRQLVELLCTEAKVF
jgi:electron transfer flavoprotein beta subunit